MGGGVHRMETDGGAMKPVALANANPGESMMTVDDRVALVAGARAALSCCDSRVLFEVGAFTGASTILLGSVAREYGQGASVVTLDCFRLDPTRPRHWDYRFEKPYFQQWMARVEQAKMLDIILCIVGRAPEASLLVPPVAMCVVDGDHYTEGVAADLEAFAPKVELSGTIWLHDYVSHNTIPPGVDAYLDKHNEWSLHILNPTKVTWAILYRVKSSLERALAEWKRMTER